MIDSRNWRDLIRPKALVVDQDSLSDRYGKFTCEPLERGFGDTIGNSLRRVLLSSLQGAAITAVKIDGALHEFTSVPDVVEDVTEMVLNFKEGVVRSHTARTQTVRIEKEGPGAGIVLLGALGPPVLQTEAQPAALVLRHLRPAVQIPNQRRQVLIGE